MPAVFVKIATRLAMSKQGRKVIMYVLIAVVFFVFAIISLVGSIASAPLDILEEYFTADQVDLITAAQGQAGYSMQAPPVDQSDWKVTGTHPWPVNGRITSNYGWRWIDFDGDGVKEKDFHRGIDIATGSGKNDPIMTVADGEVVRIKVDRDSYGLYVLVKHNGFYTLYAHLAKAYVKEGDKITRGQTIALMGGDPKVDPFPGRSTGRHLHFEVRKTADKSTRMDPLPFLNK